MNIHIKNCKSIESGEITLIPNRINIKYAVNGTGKTSIAQSIEYSIIDRNTGTNKLSELKSFKHYDNEEVITEVTGLESINSVSVFNEDYINSFVYQKDELLKDSFNILIKNQKYEQGLNEINSFIKVIAKTFESNQDLELLLKDLTELCDCFGKQTKSGYSATSAVAKGVGKGNKINNIPVGLEGYSDYIQHEHNIKWIGWQLNGNSFIDISTKCPYCTSAIEDKKESILKVSKEYDAKLIEGLNKFISVIDRLSDYFAPEVYENLISISKNSNGITTDQKKYLLQLNEQIIQLKDKLTSIKFLSFKTLKDVSKVVEVIGELKIDLKNYPFLNTIETENRIFLINESLEEIFNKAGVLQGEVNKHKKHIKDTIESNKVEINNFLKYAGYKYSVDIVDGDNEDYKLILLHNDHTKTISNSKACLSYGERNAFALVLFMFEALKDNSDIIILDDPISSFDKNKKFAILNMLFKGDRCLKNKTVIILTHDFDPIIDMVYNGLFDQQPVAHFLDNSNGILGEIEVKKSDIKTFLEITKENIEVLTEDLNKMIFLRRLYEINNDKGLGYQLLSNVFKKRPKPLIKFDGEFIEMTEVQIAEAHELIREYVRTFNYDEIISKINDDEILMNIYKSSNSNYEKLQIYRIINNENNPNRVIKKFVNETYHIENDYL